MPTIQESLDDLVANTTGLQNTVSGRITDMDTKITQADAAKTQAEQAQAASELAESSAQTAQTLAEGARDTANIAKTDAETAKSDALTAQAAASSAQTAAEAARDASIAADTSASTNKTDAITAKNAAVAAQNAADASSVAAATSESNANAHKVKAGQWADSAEDTEVETGKYSAKHWSAKAAIEKTAAASSATTAATSETNAGTSETNAASSAVAAASSETNAASSATAAASSATAANTSKTNAATSETNAASSATAAASSATAAATSEANAASAATSAVNAVIDTAPANLDTLNELAAALGDDANYAATTTTALGNRYTKAETDANFATSASPTFTGNVGMGGVSTADHKLHVKGDVAIDNEDSSTPSMLHFNATNKSNFDPTARICFWEGDAHTNDYTTSNMFIEYNGSTAGGGDGYLAIGGNTGDGADTDILTVNRMGHVKINGNYAWHAGNDGAGSGLDADTLDGLQASQFLRSDANDTATGQITFAYDDDTNYAQLVARGPDNHSGILINPTASKQAHLRFFTDGTEKWQWRVPFQDSASADMKLYSWETSSDLYVFSHNGTATFNGGTVWTSGNDGSGSGLDADKLGGKDSSKYARTDVSTETFDGGASTTINVHCDNEGRALIQAGKSTNGNQGTGIFEVTQDGSAGGGMSYNGDGSPTWANGEGSDRTTFYRMANGTRTEVFSYAHNSSEVDFNGNIKEGNTLLSDKYLGKTAKAADADKLDGINSSSFLRSDANDTATGHIQFKNDSGIFIKSSTNANGAKIKFSDATGDYNQVGTIKYLHSDGAVDTGSNDGFVFEGTETTSIFRFNGLVNVNGTDVIGTDAKIDSGRIKNVPSSWTDAAIVSATAPSNPAAGDMWFDNGNKVMKVWSGSAWDQMSNKFSATGGTESTYSSGGVNYKIHTFTSSGTFNVESAGSVDVYIAAGGGGGGGDNGAGGGAGGLIQLSNNSVMPGAYSVIVGAGGGKTVVTNWGSNGSSSSFDSNVAIGGGLAGAQGRNGASGGSGGGGSWNSSPGSGTSGQGHAGGSGLASGSQGSAGGGGGAGAAGENATGNTAPGNGGQGVNLSSKFGTSIGDSGWLCGGGAGGLDNYDLGGSSLASGRGQGGAGGGGDFIFSTSIGYGTDGQVNTGGGGGGSQHNASSSPNQSGGNGGSGIVVIRYAI